MVDLHRKLSLFKMNWLALEDEAPPALRPVIGFRYFADDTPRLLDGDVAAFWPPALVEMPSDLPGFANVAARDEDQRAA